MLTKNIYIKEHRLTAMCKASSNCFWDNNWEICSGKLTACKSHTSELDAANTQPLKYKRKIKFNISSAKSPYHVPKKSRFSKETKKLNWYAMIENSQLWKNETI